MTFAQARRATARSTSPETRTRCIHQTAEEHAILSCSDLLPMPGLKRGHSHDTSTGVCLTQVPLSPDRTNHGHAAVTAQAILEQIGEGAIPGTDTGHTCWPGGNKRRDRGRVREPLAPTDGAPRPPPACACLWVKLEGVVALGDSTGAGLMSNLGADTVASVPYRTPRSRRQPWMITCMPLLLSRGSLLCSTATTPTASPNLPALLCPGFRRSS